jgi:hypothetical protein
MRISGIESITQFTFEKNHNLYKTFITQELLKKNILGSSLIFLNIYHTKKVIDYYIKELDKIFCKIKEFEESKFTKKLLIGEVCKNTFKRLTD